MIVTMNNPQQSAWNAPGDNQTPHGFFASIRASGWSRPPSRWIGGVCSGIAEKSGWDVSLVRGVTIVASIFFGFPVILYALAWMLLPNQSDGKIELQSALAGRFDGSQLAGGALLLAGLLNPFMWGVQINAPWYGPLGLLIVAAAVVVAYTSRPNRNSKSTKESSMPDTSNHQGHAWQANQSYPAPPPAGSPFPAPYAGAYPQPVRAPRQSSAVALAVIGILLLVGAGMAGAAIIGSAYYPWFSIWVALALIVLGLTLAITALRGRRGGWLLGISIAFAVIAGPIGLGIASNYNNHFEDIAGAVLSTEMVVGDDNQTVIADDYATLVGGTYTLGSNVDAIDAQASTVTLDLTDANEWKNTDKTIDVDLQASVLVIQVKAGQPISYSIDGSMSQMNTPSDSKLEWFPPSKVGNFNFENSTPGALELKVNSSASIIKFEEVK